MKKTKNILYRYLKKIGNLVGIDLSHYVKNSIWVTLGQVISLVLGMLLSVVFARYTSKEIYGQYSFLISVISVVMIVSLPGLSSVVYRAVVTNKEKTYILAIQHSLKLGLAGVVIIAGTGLYFYYYLKPNVGIALLIISVIFPLYYPMSMWKNLLNAKQKFSHVTKYSSLVLLVNFIFVSSAIILDSENIILIFGSSVLSTIGINIFFFIRTRGFQKGETIETGWKKSGIRLTLPVIFTQLYSYADKIILMAFMGEKMLAVYSIAIIAADKISYFMGALIRVFLPKLYKTDTKMLIELLKKKIIILFLLPLVLILIIAILIPVFIKLLYTNSYSDSILPAQIYLLILPFYLLTALAGNILIKEKNEYFYTLTIVVSSVVNLLAYYILIPLVGILGGVIGSVLYFIVQTVMRVYYIFKHYS